MLSQVGQPATIIRPHTVLNCNKRTYVGVKRGIDELPPGSKAKVQLDK